MYKHISVLKSATFDGHRPPHCKRLFDGVFRFMMVLVCLIFSVLSTIDHYMGFSNHILFWMVCIGHHKSGGLPLVQCATLVVHGE